MRKGQTARVLLLVGAAVFAVGIVAGFAGMAMRWPDLSGIAIGPMIVGGVMAGVGFVMTLIQESRTREALPTRTSR